MVMKIESGKFYKTRDGRKVGPAFVTDFGTSVFGSKESYDSAVWTDTGRAGLQSSMEQKANDIIAEWQDEPKKEISDMSEVKFKVGDRIREKEGSGKEIDSISGWLHSHWNEWWADKNGESDGTFYVTGVTQLGRVEYSNKPDGKGPQCKASLLEKVPSLIPEPNTKWVFNDGQDFVVRVVGFNDKGQIVLEALSDENCGGWLAGDLFTFENEPEKFGEFYKPWVEKTKSVTGYARIELDTRTGEVSVWAEGHDTEEAARNHFDSGEGSYELLDVVKVEWSE